MLLRVLRTSSYLRQYIYFLLLVLVVSLPAIDQLWKGVVPTLPALPTFFQSFIAFSDTTSVILQMVSLLVLPALACVFRYALSTQQLIHRHNLLPCFLFVVFFAYLHTTNFLFWDLVYVVLVLWAVLKLFKSMDSPKVIEHIISASLLLSLASFLSYTAFFLFPMVWLSFMAFQQYSYKYVIASLIGFFLPYYFLLSYLFLSDQLAVFDIWQYFVGMQWFILPKVFDIYAVISSVGVLALGLWALQYMMVVLPKQVILWRRKMQLLMGVFLLSLYPFLFVQDTLAKNLTSIMIVVFASYTIGTKKLHWLLDALVSLLILGILVHKYFIYYA